jgi:hypothetical protein
MDSVPVFSRSVQQSKLETEIHGENRKCGHTSLFRTSGANAWRRNIGNVAQQSKSMEKIGTASNRSGGDSLSIAPKLAES